MPTATARAKSALALEDAGAAMLACADIEEGIVLRARRRARPDPGLRRAGRQRSRRRVRARPDADDLDAVRGARAAGRPRRGTASILQCHLKIDTGMNRLGFRHDNLARTLPEVAGSRNLAIDAVYTHFATADEPEHPRVRRAARAVRAALARAARRSAITPRVAHAANSAALLRDERVWYDFVRPACCSTASSRRRLRPRCRCDLPCHSIAVSCSEGLRPGEGTGYGLQDDRRPRRDDRRRPRRLRRRPRPPARGHAATCSSAAAARRSSARSAWT